MNNKKRNNEKGIYIVNDFGTTHISPTVTHLAPSILPSSAIFSGSPGLVPSGLFAILKALQRGSPIMAEAKEKAAIQDANEAALQEFEAGLRRSISQYKAGLVKTFKTKEEFLEHLKNLE